MKKFLVGLLCLLCVSAAVPAMAWDGFIWQNGSLENTAVFSVLPNYPNFQIKPYYNVSLNLPDVAFTTELLNQSYKGYKVLYMGVGYTASNKWTVGAGVDVLNGLRALDIEVQTPVEDFIKKWTGVEEVNIDFFAIWDSTRPLADVWALPQSSITYGIGGVLYGFWNKN